MEDPQKEKRRVELNAIVANNQRIKLGLSRKDWRKYKLFHKVYSQKLEALINAYTVDIITHIEDPEGDEAVLLLERYILKWKTFIRPLLNKLNLHDKKARIRVLGQFEETINKILSEAPSRAKAETKNESKPKINSLYKKLVILAESYGADFKGQDTEFTGEISNLEIHNIKYLVPRGKKLSFEKEAKALVKKLS